MLESHTSTTYDSSVLPPLPSNHGFRIDDRVEMPLYTTRSKDGNRPAPTVQGTIKHIDLIVAKKHYKGLVVLGDDKLYYEFHPEIARRI